MNIKILVFRGYSKENVVYLLQHSYENEYGYDETKVLGIFSDRIKAENAILEYQKLPGFCDMPENFCIDAYSLDKKEWVEGYIKV